MKTWANLYGVDKAHGVWINSVKGVKVSESQPAPIPRTYSSGLNVTTNRDELIFEESHKNLATLLDSKYTGEKLISSDCFDGWCECRADVTTSWYYIDGLFVSDAVQKRFRAQGLSALPRNPRVQSFRVFNFLGMDNYRSCTVNVDIDNYTADHLVKLVLAYYKGKLDLGITSGAGDPGGKKRYYQAIEKMVCTNFSSVELIEKKLGGGERNHYKNLLYAVVGEHTVAQVEESKKFELYGGDKLISEYNLDSTYPIVTSWTLDPAPKWNLDYGDIGLEFLFDLITDAVDAAVG